MNAELIQVVEHCLRASISGEMAFPQIIGRLAEAGVERYHTDYSRREVTYYFADGNSHVAQMPIQVYPTSKKFSAADVEGAVRQSQRGEHGYVEFVRKSMAAGCVGYFVQIAGKRVIYFGRNGETHVELFPQSP